MPEARSTRYGLPLSKRASENALFDGNPVGLARCSPPAATRCGTICLSRVPLSSGKPPSVAQMTTRWNKYRLRVRHIIQIMPCGYAFDSQGVLASEFQGLYSLRMRAGRGSLSAPFAQSRLPAERSSYFIEISPYQYPRGVENLQVVPRLEVGYQATV